MHGLTFAVRVAIGAGLLLSSLVAAASPDSAEPRWQHGYVPFGVPAYNERFPHYRYVNPDAPKGGTLDLLAIGTFDSVNPYILRGKKFSESPGLFVFGFLPVGDSLLTGSAVNPVGDEADAGYGLVAEALSCHDALDWCDFRLRENARFQDGSAITANDVTFTLETLRTRGHPRYQLQLRDVTRAEALSSRLVRFHFSGQNRRDLPLTVGHLPILSRSYWQHRDISEPTLTPPLISGPYRISDVKQGRSVTLERVTDYWGRDLPVNRGRYNFDQVRVHFFRDAQVGFEAFKSGDYDVHLDYIAKHWATAYDFPAVEDGRVVRAEIPHGIAQGTQGFFFNQRRPPFDDMRVRKALSLMFDFAWTNRAIFNNAYKRQQTWFPNSPHAATGLPDAGEQALLEPHRKALPAELFTQPFTLPEGDGTRLPRAQMQAALKLLQSAGWTLQSQKMVHSESGKPLSFEVLIYHNPGMNRVILPWLENLKRIGIQAELRAVDDASYKQRMDEFDFDVTVDVLGQRQHPGLELREYLHSSSAGIQGSRNIGGISDPVIDALLEAALSAKDEARYRTALRALDRVLLWRHAIIPHWYLDYHRLAWWDQFGRPAVQPPYSLGTDTWWSR